MCYGYIFPGLDSTEHTRIISLKDLREVCSTSTLSQRERGKGEQSTPAAHSLGTARPAVEGISGKTGRSATVDTGKRYYPVLSQCVSCAGTLHRDLGSFARYRS